MPASPAVRGAAACRARRPRGDKRGRRHRRRRGDRAIEETPLNEVPVERFRHDRWANRRLLDACAGLGDAQLDATVPGTYVGVRDTLVHLAAAEGCYLAGLGDGSGRADRFREGAPFPGIAAPRDLLAESGDGLIACAAAVAGDPVVESEWRSRTHRLPASLVLLQAIDHATEHRVHVATILQPARPHPAREGRAYDEARGTEPG